MVEVYYSIYSMGKFSCSRPHFLGLGFYGFRLRDLDNFLEHDN